MLGDSERIREVATLAGVHDLIGSLPRYYETLVGRLFGETDLSGGEWQKLASHEARILHSPANDAPYMRGRLRFPGGRRGVWERLIEGPYVDLAVNTDYPLSALFAKPLRLLAEYRGGQLVHAGEQPGTLRRNCASNWHRDGRPLLEIDEPLHSSSNIAIAGGTLEGTGNVLANGVSNTAGTVAPGLSGADSSLIQHLTLNPAAVP